MKWGMVINVSKCMRCHGCVAACRIEHFLPFGVAWVKLIASETEENGVVDVTTYPVRCNQCKEASCVDVCPTEATTQREDGIVTIESEKCIGCRYCVIACPYQNRTFLSKDRDRGYFAGHEKTRFEKMGEKLYPHQRGTTEKCNFCHEKIDFGLKNNLMPGVDRDATPACVNTCQAKALVFGDLNDPESEVSRLIKKHKAYQLNPEFGNDPSVYYIDPGIGGHDNKAPDHAQTGSHMPGQSTVEKRVRELFTSKN